MRPTEDDFRRFSAGTEFGLRGNDHRFRQYLRSIGWRSGQHMIPMLDHEPVSYLAGLLEHNRTPLPALVYIPTPEAPWGYRFIWVEPAEGGTDVPMVEVSPDTSIGMLYTALHPCADYLPEDWTTPVRFERVPG
jgi:hypothetical protein